jgi:hypothetical protein
MNSNVRAILGLDAPPTREVSRNRKGVMVYGHKTAGSIQVFTNESWQKNKKYYVSSGHGRAINNFMRG